MYRRGAESLTESELRGGPRKCSQPLAYVLQFGTVWEQAFFFEKQPHAPRNETPQARITAQELCDTHDCGCAMLGVLLHQTNIQNCFISLHEIKDTETEALTRSTVRYLSQTTNVNSAVGTIFLLARFAKTRPQKLQSHSGQSELEVSPCFIMHRCEYPSTAN